MGLGEGDKPSRETGVDCLAVFPRLERSGKRPTLEGERGNEREWGGGGGGGQIALVKGLRTKEAGLCHLV